MSRRAEPRSPHREDGFRPSEQTLRRSTSWWLLADVGVGALVSIYALAHRQADGVDPHFGHTAAVAAGAAPVVLDYLTGAAFKFPPRVDAHLAQRAPGSRLPGIEPNDVHIDLNGHNLTISGERTRTEQNGQGHASEFHYGDFKRMFTMPANIDADNVVATYNQGMLELTLPLAETAKPRRIAIGAGSEHTVANAA